MQLISRPTQKSNSHQKGLIRELGKKYQNINATRVARFFAELVEIAKKVTRAL